MAIEPGFYYHIFNRGNNSQKIFFEEENYYYFLRKIKLHITPFASIVAWCLMPNHFHLVVFLNQKTIEIQNDFNESNSHAMTQSHGMTVKEENDNRKTKERTFNYSIGILLRSYTRAINKQKNFKGSLFQQHTVIKPLIDKIRIEPSYWNIVFGTEINISEGKSYLETCIEYVHQNPYKAGLVKRVEEWEFSSLKDYLGIRKGKLLDYSLLKQERLLPEN